MVNSPPQGARCDISYAVIQPELLWLHIHELFLLPYDCDQVSISFTRIILCEASILHHNISIWWSQDICLMEPISALYLAF